MEVNKNSQLNTELNNELNTHLNYELNTDLNYEFNTKLNTELNTETNINSIYRFKFTSDFCDKLAYFAKIHEYDNLKDFKNAWKLWCEENEDIIAKEIRLLNANGFNGNCYSKMFLSARHYYRKKSNIKKQPNKRKNYCVLSKNIIKLMDEFIKTNDNLKPSLFFEEFYKFIILTEDYKNEVLKLIENGYNNDKLIITKFKKTFKNRYFVIINASKVVNNKKT